MLHIQTQLRRLLDRVELRFVRARPGSVLILVVALLVLMAMLGTAYLVTARNDRVATRLYGHNVQIDMLMDGLISLTQLTVSDQPVPVQGASTAPPNYQLAPFQAWTLGGTAAPYTTPMGVLAPTPLRTNILTTVYPNNANWPYPTMQPGYYAHYDDLMATGPAQLFTNPVAPPIPYILTYNPPTFPGALVSGSYITPTPPTTPPWTAIATGLGANKTWLAARCPVQTNGANSESYGYDITAFAYPLNNAPPTANTAFPPFNSPPPYPNYDPLFVSPQIYLNAYTPPPPVAPLPVPAWNNWQGLTFPKGVIIQESGAYYLCTADNNPLPPVALEPAAGQWATTTIGATTANPGWITIPMPFAAPVSKPAGFWCMWPAVSAPLVPGATFEDPRYNYTYDSSDPRYNATAPVTNPPQVSVRPDAARTNVLPTSVNIGGINYPALMYYSPLHGGKTWETAMAASASGDGIADSFLWRLPVSAADGITYYAAVRIIDNNSAINVNTANYQSTEFDGQGNDIVNYDNGFEAGMFPSSIGLDTLLTTYPKQPLVATATGYTDTYLGSELAALNQYRIGNLANYQGGGQYARPGGVMVNPANGKTMGMPCDDTGAARSDFFYRNLGDALWNGLGRRVSNPGFVMNSVTGAVSRYNTFDWSVAAALAFKFDLVNANATPTLLETILAPSTLNPIGGTADQSVAWDPSQVYTTPASSGFSWYTNNFLEGACVNRRAFLTTHNPTSNLIPAHSMYNMLWPGDTFAFAHVAAGVIPDYTPQSLLVSPHMIQQNRDLQSLMAGANYYVTAGSAPNYKYTTILNPIVDSAAPPNVVPPTPRTSLNTADITAQDPFAPQPAGFLATNNLNIPATINNIAPAAGGVPTPVKGPSLWLGFYNAMLDAIAPNYVPIPLQPTVTVSNPYGGYLPGSPQHFLPAIQPATVAGSNKIAVPRLGQFRSPLRDALFTPYVPAVTSSGPGPLPATPNANNYMDANQVVLLRSLIAAVNAKDLRDSDDNVTHVQATYIPPVTPPVAGRPVLAAYIQNTYTPIDVHVYGVEKQPYITEVYVNNEIVAPAKIWGPNGVAVTNLANTIGKKNPQGYVAVQLYNPYDVQIDMTNWTLGIMNRHPANYPNNMTVKTIANFPGFSGLNAIIPPKGFMLLENYNAMGTNDATYRPFSSYPNAPVIPPAPTVPPAPPNPPLVIYPVTNLSQVLTVDGSEQGTGGELFLFRQLPSNGKVAATGNVLSPLLPAPVVPPATALPGTPPGPSVAFTYAQLTQMAPVDMFDFTGMTLPTPGLMPAQTLGMACHYVRPTGLPLPLPPAAGASQAQILAYNAAMAAYRQTTWRFVYPGRWDPNKFWVTPPAGVTAPTDTGSMPYAVKLGAGNFSFQFRQEGIAASFWNLTASATNQYQYDNWNSKPPATNYIQSAETPIPSNLFQQANPLPLGGGNQVWFSNYYRLYYYHSPLSFCVTSGSAASGQFGGSYPNNFPAIQLNNMDFGGPSKINNYNSPTPNPNNTNLMFPFGGFARVGDVLQVPYIGSYMILQAGGTGLVYEINPVTTDSSYADDNDIDQVLGTDGNTNDPYLILPSNDSIEQVGRFCPLTAGDPLNAVFHPYPIGTAPNGVIPAGAAATTANTLPMQDTYAWANHVFDYFTAIGNPHDDYTPNVDPNVYSAGLWDAIPGRPTSQTYLGGGQSAVAVYQGSGGTANAGAEDTAGVEGQININTAPWTVLARVPWSISTITGAAGSNNAWNYQANQNIAQDIVRYRNTFGPFKTLFDLNKVPMPITSGLVHLSNPLVLPCFQYLDADPTLTDFDPIRGDLSPTAFGMANNTLVPHPGATGPILTQAQATDGVINDFETRYGMIIRLSNILTTRSDTFTAYLLVQGYSGVGTTTPTLVVQRRTAMIIDRTTLTGSKTSALNITPVPAN